MACSKRYFSLGSLQDRIESLASLGDLFLVILRFALSFEFLGTPDSFANLKLLHLAPLDFSKKSTSKLVQLGLQVGPS